MRHIELFITDTNFKDCLEVVSDGPMWLDYYGTKHEGASSPSDIYNKRHLATCRFRLWHTDPDADQLSNLLSEVIKIVDKHSSIK